MEPSVSLNNEPESLLQYLTFMLKGKTYGLHLMGIREIIPYSELTDVPMMPDFIAGVINLRGQVMPIIDLQQRFFGTTVNIDKRTSILVLELGEAGKQVELGVIVDVVNEVIDVQQHAVQPAPDLGQQIQTNFIHGMIEVKSRLIVLLDIEHVLTTDDFSALENISQQPNQRTDSGQEHAS